MKTELDQWAEEMNIELGAYDQYDRESAFKAGFEKCREEAAKLSKLLIDCSGDSWDYIDLQDLIRLGKREVAEDVRTPE